MKRSPILLFLAIVMPVLIWYGDASAIPAFARKYHTACSTCHLAFPVRNGFGDAFRNNGYRFPDSTDEEMVKEEPIKLGSDAYKKLFPKAIWPSDMPNMPSLGLLARVDGSLPKDRVTGKFKDSQINEELDIFFGGTITNQISYFGDFTVSPENTTLGRILFLWTFSPGISLAAGTVGFPEQFDLISSNAADGPDGFAAQLPNPNKGVELRLAGNFGKSGGYTFVAGVGRNSQTDGNSQEGDVSGGSFADTRYARATVKFGGTGAMSGSGGELGNQYIGLDNSITIGANIYNSSGGGNVNAESYTYGLTKTAYSGDIKINYGNLRLIAQYAHFCEVIDAEGTNWGARNALSLEGDYWIFPWLFGVFRYEHLEDKLNGEYTKLIPGIGVLLRPNVKFGIEYVAVTKNTFGFDPLGLENSPINSWNLYTQVGF
ncbi:MAG: hypothetical protein HGB20_04355 [Chlorobiaceae bacterium]|nr:hypothetical protein [Chlorobiaceae bacterium]